MLSIVLVIIIRAYAHAAMHDGEFSDYGVKVWLDNKESAYKRGCTGTGDFLFVIFTVFVRPSQVYRMAAPQRRRKQRLLDHDIQYYSQ